MTLTLQPSDWIALLSLAFSLIALAPQLWRRLFAKIEVHEMPSIEVGLSNLGPTIGFIGTLYAVRGAQIVTNMQLHVQKDGSPNSHIFSWRAFRANAVKVMELNNIEAEAPSAFKVNDQDLKKMSILFSDEQLLETIFKAVSSSVDEYRNFCQLHRLPFVEGAASCHPDNFAKFYAQNAASVLRAQKVMHDANYWKAGSYGMKLVIQTISPRRRYISSYKFELSPADEELLRQNVDVTFRGVFGWPDQVVRHASIRLTRCA